jgi:hypothetical protein
LNTLRYILFESPLWLILLALVAELIVLWLHQRRGWTSRRPPLIVPVVALLLLLVQWLVVTDSEALRAMTRRLASAVDAPDLDAFMAEIDADFRQRELTRDQLAERVRAILERTQIEQASVGAFEIAVNGDTAAVAFRARARIEAGDAGIREYVGRWRLECVRRDAGWRVRGVEHVSSPGLGDVPVERLLGP